LHKCSALVRVPIFDLGNIQSALDSGCSGIVFPKISSKQDALKAVSLCEFSPKGDRGFNPFARFNNYNLFKKDFYKNHKSVLKIVIIETKEGIENLEEILSVDGIDIVYLGAYDLSKEYNFKSVNNRNFLNIIDSSLAKVKLSGKISGLMINNKDYLNLAKKHKTQFLVHSVDTEIIGNAIQNILNIRK
jgi:4-hydroxy-2-oxoheptanedioate aldolase